VLLGGSSGQSLFGGSSHLHLDILTGIHCSNAEIGDAISG